MLEELKEKVLKANKELFEKKVVICTWGNVSEIDNTRQFVVIKPSGVLYEKMSVEDMVVVDLEGKVIEGKLNPSSDTPTHLEIYKHFSDIKSIAHTHSTYAVAFAQAGISIKPFGTTHADYFFGEIPITRELTKEETRNNYEINTGRVINQTIKDPNSIPAVLVKSHGPFIFGKDAIDCVYNSIVLEEIAKINYITQNINQYVKDVPQYILNKHYLRKHGEHAYYGQL
mgnify:CR=1 FL=1